MYWNSDEWRDLERLYEACQAAVTEGGVNEREENEWHGENDNELIDYCGTARSVDLWEIEEGSL